MIMKETIPRKPGSSRINKKCNNDFINALKSKVLNDPMKSMRKLATELKVDAKTIRTAVNYDLKLKSHTRTRRHLMARPMKARRLERWKKLITYLKRNKSTVKIFSDKDLYCWHCSELQEWQIHCALKSSSQVHFQNEAFSSLWELWPPMGKNVYQILKTW